MSVFFNRIVDSADYPLIEGIARVVAVDGAMVWLEPEQRGSCSGCSSASVCGAKGLGTLANRLEARRFSLANEADLQVGERVVVGIREDALIKAAATAYALPLVVALTVAGLAQWAWGSDGITLAASVAGLLLGVGAIRIGAGGLMARGIIAPRLLRRAAAGETCD